MGLFENNSFPLSPIHAVFEQNAKSFVEVYLHRGRELLSFLLDFVNIPGMPEKNKPGAR